MLPNQVQTQHYKKEEKKNIFFHFDSALPMNMKRIFVTNKWKRVVDRCSSQELKRKHHSILEGVLIANGYPSDFLRQVESRRKDPTTSLNQQSLRPQVEPLYMKIPFIDDVTLEEDFPPTRIAC